MVKIMAVKVENGSVRAFDSKGSFLRTIVTGGSVSATVNGDIISVTKADGRVELYDANTGSFKRSI